MDQMRDTSRYSDEEIERIKNLSPENDRTWRQYAHCLDTDTDDFFVTNQGAQKAIIEAECNKCLVVEACLKYALRRRETNGVWGGTTDKERQRMLRRANSS